jgi:uncharacterized protein YutE (UPF0331/DUF86 family)/predicted nucleotidyltransferase
MEKEEKIEKLKEYFEKRDDVVLAYIFGSQAKGTERRISDWDLGVYFHPKGRELELEEGFDYPQVTEIWREIERIVKSDVDLVVLNNAYTPLVYTTLNTGIPIVQKDMWLYRRLLTKTFYEALDFWQFAQEFWDIRQRSASLSAEDRIDLERHIIFLKNELSDLDANRTVSQHEYTENRATKRNIERWVENIIMASLDIAKIILSSEKKDMPSSYRETLHSFGMLYFDEKFADNLSGFANLRNIIAHEYLDIRWQRIQNFLKQVDNVYPALLEKAEVFLEKDK